MPRYLSITSLRAIGILLMIQVHFVWYLTMPEDQNLTLYRIMVFLGELPAPLFFFTMGVSLIFAVHKRNKKTFKHIVRRYGGLIITGLVFITLWQASILHYLGIYGIITYVTLPFSKSARILAATAILVTTPAIVEYFGYMSGWEKLGYRLADFWTLKGFCINLLASGFFPMFPWLACSILGSVAGEYLLQSVLKDNERRFCIMSIAIGCAISAGGWLLAHFTTWKITFYPPTVSFILFFLGVCLVLLGLLFWFFDVLKGANRTVASLLLLGDMSLSAYILHIVLGPKLCTLTTTCNSLPLKMVLPAIIVMLLFLGFICSLSVHRLGKGPIEHVFSLLFLEQKKRD